MSLQRWERRQSWCERSGASRDTSVTHLSLTLTLGGRGEQSAAGQEEGPDSQAGLGGGHTLLAGITQHGSTTERLPAALIASTSCAEGAVRAQAPPVSVRGPSAAASPGLGEGEGTTAGVLPEEECRSCDG